MDQIHRGQSPLFYFRGCSIHPSFTQRSFFGVGTCSRLLGTTGPHISVQHKHNILIYIIIRIQKRKIHNSQMFRSYIGAIQVCYTLYKILGKMPRSIEALIYLHRFSCSCQTRPDQRRLNLKNLIKELAFFTFFAPHFHICFHTPA